MKRIFALILVLISILTLTSCGNKLNRDEFFIYQDGKVLDNYSNDDYQTDYTPLMETKRGIKIGDTIEKFNDAYREVEIKQTGTIESIDKFFVNEDELTSNSNKLLELVKSNPEQYIQRAYGLIISFNEETRIIENITAYCKILN